MSTAMAEDGSESRDWSEMPSDALAAVFGKLDGNIMDNEKVKAMARTAVDRAAGTMEAFWADYFVTDGLLLYVSMRASSLKSLHLILCRNVSNEGMSEAMKDFPQLEELDITVCSLYGDVCQSIGKACPQLKCFRLNKACFGRDSYDGLDYNTEALGIANNMPELRELQLIGNHLTKDGLMSILDNCLHQESVDIRCCRNIRVDDALKSECARIRNLELPGDSDCFLSCRELEQPCVSVEIVKLQLTVIAMCAGHIEQCVTSIPEVHEATCWGCGLQLIFASYAPVFKCGWCGAITQSNQTSRNPDSICFSHWRHFRDWFFVTVLILFMLFVICGGVWAIYPQMLKYNVIQCIHLHSTDNFKKSSEDEIWQ
ncbi:hypothetical protein GUJ93_ZPchr0458g22349 [Zizania palustris]|uniref:Uncharacterized protein n=1 Tax=Zizania palustris TaxID=103762 RepID=A0A8J5RDF1_ZIZPA|nr:hypothetical protein GUJ93_ZPchr0458g22349 [Zizania palustris]